jgi:hypothetical protein
MCTYTTPVAHLTMLVRHLEKQLDESRTEAENLRRRLELLGEECEKMTRDKSAMLNVIARKVSFVLFFLQFSITLDN